MNYKFRIPFDDMEKITPIFEKFGQNGFTRSKVVADASLPQITSGDIVRWEGHGILECLGREITNPLRNKSSVASPYVWRITDRTVYAINKNLKPGCKGV
jgi:hypothetical protein